MMNLWRLVWVLLLFQAPRAVHPCDAPPVSTVTGSTVVVQACWTGMDTATPPALVVNPTWTVGVDGITAPIAMQKVSGVGVSTKGQYLFEAPLTLTAGFHAIAIAVTGPTGMAPATNSPITVTVPTVPNKAPVVQVSGAANTQINQAVSLSAAVTDDGLPLRVSPDGWRGYPGGPIVIDNQLSRWNLATAPGPAPGPYTDVYRNGVQRFDQGIGSQILWHAGNIYIKGDDDLWYYWTNGQYVGNVGAVDPGVPAVPDLPPAVSQVWSLTSGPGLVVWSAQTALQTTATFSQPGTYVVRLTASDSLAMGFDETTVTVQAVPVSPSLVVSARVTKCQLSVSAQAPPDTQAGWTYQVRYGTGTAPPTVNFGRADTKAPYLATGTLDPGTYTFAATWTRPNTPSVTTPTQPGACQ